MVRKEVNSEMKLNRNKKVLEIQALFLLFSRQTNITPI
jgi:hypothetical protein